MPSILFRPKPNVEKTPAAPKASPLCCGSQNQLTKSTNMSTALNNHSTRSTVPGTVAFSDDELRRFAPSVFASQPIEGVSENTVFFLLPPFSTGCAKMVGFPYAHKSRAFELKHGAASKNTLSGLLVLSISRPGKRTKSGPRSVL